MLFISLIFGVVIYESMKVFQVFQDHLNKSERYLKHGNLPSTERQHTSNFYILVFVVI